MTRFGSKLIVVTVACTALCTTAGVAEGPSGPPIRMVGVAPQREPTRLEPGRPVSQSIAAGETHRYRVGLQAKEVLHVIATQLGADIVVTPFLDLAEHPERTLAALFIRCRHLEEPRSQIVGRTRVLREHVGAVAVRPPLNEGGLELVANALRHR
jgi:hypothetical protein